MAEPNTVCEVLIKMGSDVPSGDDVALNAACKAALTATGENYNDEDAETFFGEIGRDLDANLNQADFAGLLRRCAHLLAEMFS